MASERVSMIFTMSLGFEQDAQVNGPWYYNNSAIYMHIQNNANNRQEEIK